MNNIETQNCNPTKVFGKPEFKNNILYVCFYKHRHQLCNDKVGTFFMNVLGHVVVYLAKQ